MIRSGIQKGKGWRRRAAIFGIAAMLATACAGGDGADPGDGAPDPTGNGDATEPDGNGTGPQTGGTLTVASFGETSGFDPIRIASSGLLGGTRAVAIYDSLTRLDADGNAVPYLAESLEPNDDLTVWTMKLRPGVMFHDDTPLDADAVVFNIERHMDPDNGSPAAAVLESVASVEAADDLTVVFTLSEPFGPFANVFLEQAGWIASPTAVEAAGDDYNNQPVGAGPFMFVSWSVDEELRLVRNPNYWQEGKPYLDEVIFRPNTDAISRFASVQSGDVDVAPTIEGPQLEAAAGDPEMGVTQIIANGGQGIVVNVEQVDDIRVRQALLLAMNRDVISDVQFDGAMPVARGPFPPDSQWFNESTAAMWPGYDPDAAKSLMDEVLADQGVDSITLGLSCSNSPARAELAELLQEMWRPIGVNVDIQLLDVAELVAGFRNGDFELGCHTISAFEDPVPRLEQQFQSGQVRNYSNWFVDEVDAAFDRGRTTVDLTVRKEAYDLINQRLAEELPYLLYSNSLQGHVYGSAVHMDGYNGELVFYPADVWKEG